MTAAVKPSRDTKPTHRRKRIIGRGWAEYVVINGVVWCLSRDGFWFESVADLEMFNIAVEAGEIEVIKETTN